MAKDYKLISDSFIEKLMEQLNNLGDEGWSIAAYVQEYGVTKIILEKESD